MTKQHKFLTKMRNNPMNWRIEELETVANHYGINVRKSGGSHVILITQNRLNYYQFQQDGQLSQFI